MSSPIQCAPNQVPIEPGICMSSIICDNLVIDRPDLRNAVQLGVADQNFHPRGNPADVAERLTQYVQNIAGWCFAAVGAPALGAEEYAHPPGLQTRDTNKQGSGGAKPPHVAILLLIAGAFIYTFSSSVVWPMRFIKRNQLKSSNAYLMLTIYASVVIFGALMMVSAWFLATLKVWNAPKILCLISYIFLSFVTLISRVIVHLAGYGTYCDPESFEPGYLSAEQYETLQEMDEITRKLTQTTSEAIRSLPSQNTSEQGNSLSKELNGRLGILKDIESSFANIWEEVRVDLPPGRSEHAQGDVGQQRADSSQRTGSSVAQQQPAGQSQQAADDVGQQRADSSQRAGSSVAQQQPAGQSQQAADDVGQQRADSSQRAGSSVAQQQPAGQSQQAADDVGQQRADAPQRDGSPIAPQPTGSIQGDEGSAAQQGAEQTEGDDGDSVRRAAGSLDQNSESSAARIWENAIASFSPGGSDYAESDNGHGTVENFQLNESSTDQRPAGSTQRGEGSASQQGGEASIQRAQGDTAQQDQGDAARLGAGSIDQLPIPKIRRQKQAETDVIASSAGEQRRTVSDSIRRLAHIKTGRKVSQQSNTSSASGESASEGSATSSRRVVGDSLKSLFSCF